MKPAPNMNQEERYSTPKLEPFLGLISIWLFRSALLYLIVEKLEPPNIANPPCGKIVDETRMQIRIIFIYIALLDNFNDLANVIIYKNAEK